MLNPQRLLFIGLTFCFLNIEASFAASAYMKRKSELRVGAGLPLTLIASTPGVIQINTNIEYSKVYENWIPLFKIQYSNYQRVSRKSDEILATQFDNSLSSLEIQSGLKWRIQKKKNELRPFLAVGFGLGKFKFKNEAIEASAKYNVYTVGLEVFSPYKEIYFLSIVGTLSKINYRDASSEFNIEYNRPTLELNFGIIF